ncbi:MAG: type VI secretion system tip protein VgrG [Bacteroidia bacterium]|nr:type VI secretion system tip protein VgrG [Bacteroidia bacterium]
MPAKDLATFDLLVEGSPYKNSFDVISIRVVKEINRIAYAQIKLQDGNPALQAFPLSDSGDLIPGKKIEIKMGYDSTNKTIFKGVITGHAIQNFPGTDGVLEIEARDEAVKMTIARNNKYYEKQKDSEIISSLIGNHGVSADVEATSYKWPEVIQYYCTDWDFMLARAEVNGMFVFTDNGKVSVKKLKSSGPVATFAYGPDIYGFSTGMDVRRQIPSVEAESWGFSSQALNSSSSSEPSAPAQGNLTGKKLSEVVGPSSFKLRTSAPLESAPLKAWADAQLAKSRFAFIRGTLQVPGLDSVNPGTCIKLEKMGDRFNGTAFVSGVEHRMEVGNWNTFITTGVDDNWYVDRVQTEARASVGLMPGIRGLLNATVVNIHEDPDSETRVKVSIPLITEGGDGIWARMSKQYATNGAGYFWMPEVGDEVIVGFLNEDPRFPVILGSLYSSQKTPPYTPDQKNTKKAIVSNTKIFIEFDDENKVLTIQTPSKNTVILSDKDKSISIHDQNGNKIDMTDAGIKMTSPKDIELTATGKVKIKGTAGVAINSDANIDIKATASLNAQGLSTSVKADTQLSLEGSAAAELKGGGMLTLKGGMVMIN